MKPITATLMRAKSKTMTKTYYNTTKAYGDQLQLFIGAAKTQQQAIKLLFARYPELSPSHCMQLLERKGKRWPITSIRRSFTNLTNEGYLTKTDRKQMGIYGRPEYIWQLAK